MGKKLLKYFKQNNITYHYFELPTKKTDFNNLSTHPIIEVSRKGILITVLHNKKEYVDNDE